MKQLTIRRIDEAWIQAAKAESLRRGVSMNQVLVDALGKGLGMGPAESRNGLEQFSGSWELSSAEDDRSWERSMRVFEEVDPELWK